MTTINELIKNVDLLNEYLDNNFGKVIDFFQQDFKSLQSHRTDIESFILLNKTAIANLDASKYSDFILLLLEATEKLGLEAEFLSMFNIVKQNKIPISNKFIAASLFLTNIHSDTAYKGVYEKVIEHLQKGYDLEEDNEEKILFTFLNYFSQALSYFGEFNPNVISDIKLKITESIKSGKYAFLKNEQIQAVLSLNPNYS